MWSFPIMPVLFSFIVFTEYNIPMRLLVSMCYSLYLLMCETAHLEGRLLYYG